MLVIVHFYYLLSSLLLYNIRVYRIMQLLVGSPELLSNGTECERWKEAFALLWFSAFTMNGNVNVFPDKFLQGSGLMMSTLSFTGPRFTTKNLTLAAMLIALQVILEKLSIGDPSVLKFSFGFVATALLGYCLGPWISAWAMVVADIISNSKAFAVFIG